MLALEERQRLSKQVKMNDLLKNIGLFANLPDADIALFAKVAQIMPYIKGAYLYLEGDQANSFYIICSGWIKLFNTTDDGEELILAMLTKDSITGETAIFEQGHFTSGAQVVEDAQILNIPLSLLTEQLRLNNLLAMNMLNSMVQYQRRHEMQLEQYLLYSAPQRIGCFLLGLLPVSEHKNGATLELPYDKTLIASTLGMKGATFSRALNILREETNIQISGTCVKIVSMERLLEFVNGCYSQTHLRGGGDYLKMFFSHPHSSFAGFSIYSFGLSTTRLRYW